MNTERTIEQLNEENKSFREKELEMINELDVPEDLKETLIKILDEIEDEMGELNEEEKTQLTKYIRQKHKVNTKREELVKEMLQKCGIENTDNIEEGVKEIEKKGFSLVKYVDDALEDKKLYKYSVEDKDKNTLAYFYQIVVSNEDVENIKFSKVIMGEEEGVTVQ